ncbi:lectin, mannose-binding 2 [Nematocida sp. AWRm77]|nr:lectin, mannose-binding 2 [Nematocida sp. AWRm77]
MNISVVLVCLGAFVLESLCSGVRLKYNGKMSLHQPYVGLKKEAWGIRGDTVIVSKGAEPGVHLLTNTPNSFGGIVALLPLRMSGWRADIYMQISKCKSIGIWAGSDQVGVEKEGIFGGSNRFSGVVSFLSFEKTKVTPRHPVAGIASGNGRDLLVEVQKKVSLNRSCVVRLQYIDGEFTMFCGSSINRLDEIGTVKDVYLTETPYLGITGDTSQPGSEIVITNISMFLAAKSANAREAEEEANRTRSSFVWLVFLVMFGGIGVYLYKQRAPVKSKKILSH